MMENNIEKILKELMPKPEDVLLIRSLFSHPGWSRYRETIDRDIEFLTSEINNLTDGKTVLTQERIEQLKLLSILRYAFKSMIVRHEQLLDEIDNPLVTEEQEIMRENFTVPENGA